MKEPTRPWVKPQEILAQASEIAKQKNIEKGIAAAQEQQEERKRMSPFKLIQDVNTFAKTPIGGFAMEALGLADKKKQTTNNSPFGRTLASLRDNWTVFFLIPFALGTAMLFMAMMAVFFWKLMTGIMGWV